MRKRIIALLVTVATHVCFLQLASADNHDERVDEQPEPTVELAISYERNDSYRFSETDERIGIEKKLATLKLNYDHPFILTESLSGHFSINSAIESEDVDRDQPINSNHVDLEELWLGWTTNNKSLWVGRRMVEDTATWWWDDELLGTGITFNTREFSSQLTAAIASEPWSSLNVSEDPEEESIFLLLGSAQARMTQNFTLATFFSHQTDSSSDYQATQSIAESKFDEQDDQLTWLGLRYEGDLIAVAPGVLSFSFDVAWMTGKSTAYQLEGGDEGEEGANEDETESGESALVTVSDRSTTSLSAWALNGWLSWKPPTLRGANIRFGYAYGSRTFRQTGLHSNEASTQYYGYIANPSLSNLHITSLLINYSIHEKSNIFAQYNRYRRASINDDSLEWNVDLEFENNSRDIGYEISAGYEHEFDNDFQIEIHAASFYPGDAFSEANARWLNRYMIAVSYEF